MSKTVAERVRAILVEQLGVEEEEVTAEAKLRDDLDADSLDMVETAMAIEDAFKLPQIEDDTVFATVGDVVAYVEQRVANQQPS